MKVYLKNISVSIRTCCESEIETALTRSTEELNMKKLKKLSVQVARHSYTRQRLPLAWDCSSMC